MTITQRKASLEQYPGKQAVPGFAAYWQEAWEQAALTGGNIDTVPFCNPMAVYKTLTLETAHADQIRARYIRPVGEGPFPMVLMFHDLHRPIRGWHHMTRFVALGFGVLALENRYQQPDWRLLKAQEMELALRDAMALGQAALFLPHTDPDRLYAWGEGFGGGLAAAVSAMLPQGARCAVLNPCPCDVEIDGWERIDCTGFAPLLKKPLLLGTGLLDTMAPPEGQYALYNRAVCEKRHKVYAKYAHERINFFENEMMRFFHEEKQ